MVPSSSQLGSALIASVREYPELLDAKVKALHAFLGEYHLMHLLPQINRYIGHVLEVETSARGCHITTALPLDVASRDQLLGALDIAADGIYQTGIDESLIGGCTIANKGVLYDASLKTSLERLRLSLQN
jgi:F0F1-type ATP synthase delta subunit